MAAYDLVIVGGGGAGLTAAIYASRAKLKTLVLEKLAPGGQIALTDVVENYPGFPEGVTGPDVSMRMEKQARRFGTEVHYEEVQSVSKSGAGFLVKTARQEHHVKAVIIASGASFRMMGVPGEKELIGKGVSYCATCDGPFFKDKEIMVVGGGDSAMQEGLFLTRFVKKLNVVHRRDRLRASPILQERARENRKMSFTWDTAVTRIDGRNKVEAVRVKHLKSGEEQTLKTEGVFIFIGHDPATGFLKDFVKLDDKGYVITHDGLQTSVPGVFAAGEVRAGAVKQLVSACGEGCEAALAAQSYLEELVSKN